MTMMSIAEADAQLTAPGQMFEIDEVVIRGVPTMVLQVHTGDVARLDEEGFVYIVDRAKDMLIRGGENVYCVEIESVLYGHPAVDEAAVIGIPHPTLGEEVGAVVHIRPGMQITERDLQEHVRSRLAAFKVPVKVWFYEGELPRNPAGKVLKRDLRDELVGPG